MKHLKTFFAFMLMAVLSIGQVWADVESGTTYTTDPKTPSVPANWTVNSYAKDANYTKLASNTNYIQTDEFCQNGFTSIKIKARKYGGPSAAQAVISVEWFENGGSSTVLATVSPTGTSLADYTLSELESVTGNKSGYIKISCKAASGGKGCGVSQVTITYTAGACGGGTPTCATPTFSPEAGSYEGTQNVTISSTAGATIYYTTNGSTPTTSSSVYSSPIAVSEDMTIKAYAVKTGSNDSEVATAAYTITEGPDVTLNLLDEGWEFPTSKVVAETSYTNGDYTIKVAGTTGNGFRTYGTYFLLGQSGAYIELPEFDDPIEKIVVTGNSGGSDKVTWNIFNGDDAVSTAATGCKNDAYTFNIDPVEANAIYRLKVTNAANLQIKAIKIFFGEAPAIAKPTISGDESFVGSTTVTISHADADAIYYTTDGSNPKTSGTKLTYSAPFTVNADGTTTVKAYAVKGSDASDVASKEFTKVTALTTMADVQNAAEATEKAINVVISNWVVTAVSGGQVWFTDAENTKGILLYKSSNGFAVGKKLNGTVIGTKIKLYNLYPELTSLVASEVTITDASTINPRTTTIAALTSGHPAEQGTIVKLEGVSYSSSVLSDGKNTIAADNKFFSSLALVEGTTYDITGVVTYYQNGDDAVVKIAPRSADDVEAKSAVVTPTAANLSALKAATRGTYILTLTNAVVTYVNGNNAFIEDATGGALIFFANHGYSAGDCLNGDYQVTTTDYQGKFEITAMEPQTGAATTTAEIPLTTVSIATLNANFSSYESRRVKIAGANVTDAISGSDRNGAISDGEALAVYAAAGASTITLTADKNVDIIGYPGFYNTNQQLNVWAQADITINESEEPEKVATPTFSPAEGEYDEAKDVTISCATNGATIYYTIDGSTPTNKSSVYSSAISVSETTTIKAFAVKDGMTDSDIASATYTITTGGGEDPDNTVTFDYTDYKGEGTTSTGSEYTMVKTDIVSIGDTKFYGNNNQAHFYANGMTTITPASGITITQIVLTATESSYNGYQSSGTVTASTGSLSHSGAVVTWTGSADAAFTISHNKQIRWLAIEVTYETVDPDAPALAVVPNVIDFGDVEQGETVSAKKVAVDFANLTGAVTYSGLSSPFSASGTISATGDEITISADATVAVGEYEQTLTVTSTADSKSATVTVTMNVLAAETGEQFVKVTTTPAESDWSGDYLLVYESGTTAYVWDGTDDAEKCKTATIKSGNVIAKPDGAAIVSIEAMTGGYSLQINGGTNDGKYIVDNGSNSALKFGDAAYAATISYETNWTKILFSERCIRFNSSSGQNRFRYYADNSQQDVQLYKAVNSKASAGLTWSAETVELTVGGAFTSPTLSHADGITGAITYASDKESVATVDANGVISLVENATGTAHITATYAGDDNFKSGSAVCTIKVNPAHSIYVSPSLTVNFGSVEKDASVDDQVITVTLTEVPNATATLGGNNPEKFSITPASPAALTASGNITISVANTATAGTFEAKLTISDDAGLATSRVVTLKLTVTDPAAEETPISTSTKWVVATAADLVDGAEVIITSVKDEVVYAMGEQKSTNRAGYAASVDGEGVLTPGSGTMSFTLVAQEAEGVFALRTSDGKYLYAAASGSNHMKTQDDVDANAQWTLTVTSAVATGSTNRNVMQFNGSGTNNLFSCYGSASQTAIQFYVQKKYTVTYAANGGSGDAPDAVEYVQGATFTVAAADLFTAPNGKEFDKWNDGTNDYAPDATYTVGTSDVVLTAQWKDAAVTPDPEPTPDYGSYQRPTTAGNYGTICLPKAGTITGAALYEIADYKNGTLYCDQVVGNVMEAGKPYLFFAMGEQLNVTYTSDEEVAAGNANGLYGFYDLEDEDAHLNLDADDGNYILYSNQYWLVSGRDAYISNYRAYLKIAQINYVAPAPGRRRVAMSVNGEQVATGIENINASENPVKLIINDHIYILRGEKMYDATGRLVK